MMNANMTLYNNTRSELLKFAIDLLQNHLHQTVFSNLSLIQEKNRYFNWYNGYTKLELPNHSHVYGFDVSYEVNTIALSGTIYTKHFGEKFDPKNVATSIYGTISISGRHINI